MSNGTSEGSNLVRRFFEEFWNKRKFDVLEEIVTKDCLLHVGDSAHSIASEKSRKAQRDWVASFPDLTFNLQDIVEQGGLVAVRLIFEGTQKAEFEGIPPRNQKIRVTESLFAKVSGGKIVEMWEDYDRLGMMKQLGYNLSKPAVV